MYGVTNFWDRKMFKSVVEFWGLRNQNFAQLQLKKNQQKRNMKGLVFKYTLTEKKNYWQPQTTFKLEEKNYQLPSSSSFTIFSVSSGTIFLFVSS